MPEAFAFVFALCVFCLGCWAVYTAVQTGRGKDDFIKILGRLDLKPSEYTELETAALRLNFNNDVGQKVLAEIEKSPFRNAIRRCLFQPSLSGRLNYLESSWAKFTLSSKTPAGHE